MVSDQVVLGSVMALSIAAIEVVALSNGIDGVLLTASVAAIVGILAYLYPSPLQKK